MCINKSRLDGEGVHIGGDAEGGRGRREETLPDPPLPLFASMLFFPPSTCLRTAAKAEASLKPINSIVLRLGWIPHAGRPGRQSIEILPAGPRPQAKRRRGGGEKKIEWERKSNGDIWGKVKTESFPSLPPWGSLAPDYFLPPPGPLLPPPPLSGRSKGCVGSPDGLAPLSLSLSLSLSLCEDSVSFCSLSGQARKLSITKTAQIRSIVNRAGTQPYDIRCSLALNCQLNWYDSFPAVYRITLARDRESFGRLFP